MTFKNHSRIKASLSQKLFLIFFGILLGLVLVELGLRLAGTVVQLVQEANNEVFFDKNEYRILCLGESTTALGGLDSYPSQLQQILDQHVGAIKFRVINKGVVSTTSNYILDRLDQNLNKYKPNLVILMMGINDNYYYRRQLNKPFWLWQVELFVRNLRVPKLVYLFYVRTTQRFIRPTTSLEADVSEASVESSLKTLVTNELTAFQERLLRIQKLKEVGDTKSFQDEYKRIQDSVILISNHCVDLAHRYVQRGLWKDAKQYLARAEELSPRAYYVHEEWGKFYLAQGNTLQAIQSFNLALHLNPDSRDALQGLAKTYYQQKDGRAIGLYEEYLKHNPKDYWANLELGLWLKEKGLYPEAEAYLTRAIKIEPTWREGYIRLGELYELQAKSDQAKQYFDKAAQVEIREYSDWSRLNYNAVLRKILDRGITVIVMQYPMRSIDPLKGFIGKRNGLTFVENRDNFTRALLLGGYNEYFSDKFAGDFGHCTRRGNRLIAENLKPVIVKVLGSSN